MTQDTHELAWSAGLFDGEGHARADHRTITFGVTQIDRGVLDRLHIALGRGKVYGPYASPVYGRAPKYCFALHRFEDVQFAVAVLWRWLSPIKRAQCSEALQDFTVRRRERLSRVQAQRTSPEWIARCRAQLQDAVTASVKARQGKPGTFTGRTHTAEARQKMRESRQRWLTERKGKEFPASPRPAVV